MNSNGCPTNHHRGNTRDRGNALANTRDRGDALGTAPGSGNSDQRQGSCYSEWLVNLGCSFALTPVGTARQQVGVLTAAHADPHVLLNVIKDVQLHWPFGRACDVEWRR